MKLIRSGKCIGLLLLGMWAAFLPIMTAFNSPESYELFGLTSILNIVFNGFIPLCVVYIAFMAFLEGGSLSIIFMGGGMLAFGLGAINAGILLRSAQGPNDAVTVFNLGLFLSAILHNAGTLSSVVTTRQDIDDKRRSAIAVLIYLCVALTAFVIHYATYADYMPSFFIPDQGPTPLRQIVIALAIVLYVQSAIMMMTNFLKTKSEFFLWYSSALALMSLGLFALFIHRTVGNPLGWYARISIYIAAILTLIAVMRVGLEKRFEGLSLEKAVAGLFADSEASYIDLVENAQDAIVTLDRQGRIINWNFAAETMFGYGKPEVIGLPFYEHFNIPYVVSKEKLSELDLKSKSGDLIPVEIAASQRKGIYGTITTLFIRDISERKENENRIRALYENLENLVRERTAQLENEIEDRKQIEKALFESTVKYRALYEESTNGVMLLDREGTILDANRSAIELTCFGIEELRGKQLKELIDEDDLQVLPYQLPEVLTGKTVQLDRRIKRKDGELLIVETTARLIGENLIQTIYHDITERNKLQELLTRRAADLAHTNEELIRSNKDLEHFAYVASHDLQEPLRNVAASLQVLQKRHYGTLGEESDTLINYAVAGAKKMRALIRGLLTYSRISTKGSSFETVPMIDVLTRSLSNLKILIEENSAIITHGDLPEIKADADQLTLVLQNLIQNAVKFRSPENPQIHISARRQLNEWIFSVQDNGIGIEKDYFEKIFVIFQQLQKNANIDGTGMGLAIVKKIIERHRGRIWLESKVGAGSTFYFSIPDVL